MDEEICMRRFSCLDKKETSLGFQRSSFSNPHGREDRRKRERHRESVCVCGGERIPATEERDCGVVYFVFGHVQFVFQKSEFKGSGKTAVDLQDL
jgi:hypothetical protein